MADNSINASKIVAGSVTTAEIAANTIATSNIADNAIDGTKIAQNSILTKHIDDAQVNTAQLAGNSVASAKIQTDAVTADKIAANAVSTSELKSDALSGQVMTGAVGFSGVVNAQNTLGIQDSSPPQKFHMDEVAGLDVNSGTSSSTSQFTLDTFSASIFRTAKYTISIKNTTDSDYQALEILLIHQEILEAFRNISKFTIERVKNV